MTTLGEELMVGAFALEGYVPPKKAIKLQLDLIRVIGMMPVGRPVIRIYPVPSPEMGAWKRLWWRLRYFIFGKVLGGVGGVGETVWWAHSSFQALAESTTASFGAVMTDTWPEKAQGKGKFYLIIASCRRFEMFRVRNFLFSQGHIIINHADLVVG